MTITRADVADLREGDVVELTDERWPDGTVLRGPAYFYDGELRVGHLALATCDGRLYVDRPRTTLTVISRAPRLYTNSDRSEPVAGDVVRNADDDSDTRTWAAGEGSEVGSGWWVRLDDGLGNWEAGSALPDRLRLLVDGHTGMAVPS